MWRLGPGLLWLLLLVASPAAGQEGDRWHPSPQTELEGAEIVRDLELGVEPAREVPPDVARQRATMVLFHRALSPYGAWHSHPEYGLIWVPSAHAVGVGFAPYLTHGHWALDAGGSWVWVSEHPFGYVVFRYGRWFRAPGLGWAWVPGFEYAPAWVAWRVPVAHAGYFGWAPLPPHGFWRGGHWVHVAYPSHNPWIFCPGAYAFSSHLERHALGGREQRGRLLDRTRPLPASAVDNRFGPSLDQAGVPNHVAPSRVLAPTRSLAVSDTDGRRLRRSRVPRDIDSSEARPVRLEPPTLERSKVERRRPRRARPDVRQQTKPPPHRSRRKAPPRRARANRRAPVERAASRTADAVRRVEVLRRVPKRTVRKSRKVRRPVKKKRVRPWRKAPSRETPVEHHRERDDEQRPRVRRVNRR